MAQFVVGISDLKVACSPDTLITYALGSCVGICLYDFRRKIGGLSHILLPDSSVNTGNVNLFKFADTAIAQLVKAMEAQGCKRISITAKIAGGANMFASPGISIGDRNVQAVKNELDRLKISIFAEDTGGNYGRTVILNPENGEVTVKAITKGIKII